MTRPQTLRLLSMVLAALVLSSGCTQVPVSQQRLVSKPNMIFDETSVFAFSSRLSPQSEPGSASSGGAQGSGCTACK